MSDHQQSVVPAAMSSCMYYGLSPVQEYLGAISPSCKVAASNQGILVRARHGCLIAIAHESASICHHDSGADTEPARGIDAEPTLQPVAHERLPHIHGGELGIPAVT